MKQKIRKSALCIGATLTVLLPACGGGGGSDDSSPPPPVQKYTLSGTVRPATDNGHGDFRASQARIGRRCSVWNTCRRRHRREEFPHARI